MNKKHVRFLLETVALAGLLGIWIFLKNGESLAENTAAAEQTPRSDTDNSDSSTNGDAATEQIGKDFRTIHVEYGDGRKPLEINVNEKESSITDLDTAKTEENIRERVVAELQNLLIERDLGEQADLAQYGLAKENAENSAKDGAGEDEKGTADVRLTQENGTVLDFQIGASVTGKDDAVYALQDGKVLILSSFPNELLEGRTAFYKKTLISIATRTDAEGYAADEFEYLEFSKKEDSEVIRIVPDEEAASGYLMIEPVRAEALLGETNADTGSVSIYDLLDLIQAEKAEVENCDEQLLLETALADGGICSVSYSLNGEEHVVRIGKKEDDGYDLMLDDDPALYLVQKEWAEKVINLSVMDLRASYIWLVNLSDIESVSVSCEGSERKYQIQDNGDAYCDGKKIEKEQFLPKYQELIGMTILNTEKPEETKGETVLDIAYHYKADKKQDTASHDVKVEIVSLEDSDRYAAYLDGEFAGILRNDTVEAVVQSWK